MTAGAVNIDTTDLVPEGDESVQLVFSMGSPGSNAQYQVADSSAPVTVTVTAETEEEPAP